MKVRAIRTRIFEEGEDLSGFILRYIPKARDGAIVVVTSKIVALSEGRVAVAHTAREKERLIRQESDWAIKTKYVWLAIRDGVPMANAGVDESNAAGKIVLLPKNCFASAAALRRVLKKKYKVRRLGVVITDSRVFPLRGGVTGVALGYAGFRGVRDYRGKKDIFGRNMTYTRSDIADSIATAAVLEMGEGREQRPLALVEDPSVEFSEKIDRDELLISIDDDMYAPLFRKDRRRKRR